MTIMRCAHTVLALALATAANGQETTVTTTTKTTTTQTIALDLAEEATPAAGAVCMLPTLPNGAVVTAGACNGLPNTFCTATCPAGHRLDTWSATGQPELPELTPAGRCNDGAGRFQLVYRQTAPFYSADWDSRNPDDSAADNFGILDSLEEFRKTDGSLELKLVWPDATETERRSRARRQGRVLVPGPSDAAVQCAIEHGHGAGRTCRCIGTVFYGENRDGTSRWYSREVDGHVGCNNGVFGDPWRGMPKRCFCEAAPQEPLAALDYNHWTQISNPTVSTNTVEGYTPVVIYHDGFRWGGLARSANGANSVMDGSIGSRHRYFTVGAQRAFNGGLPAFSAAPAPVTELYACKETPAVEYAVSLSCDADGPAYNRSSTGTACVAATCAAMELPRGTVTGSCTGTFGSTCSYGACEEGFTLSEYGQMSRTCGGGEYSGQPKECVPVRCVPLRLSAGRISGDCDGNVGDECTYAECNRGWRLSDAGSPARTCGADGAYSGTPKTCVIEPSQLAATCRSTGDPHFMSLDGRHFNFQQAGLHELFGSPNLAVHVRHTRWHNSRAAINTWAAVGGPGMNGDTLQFFAGRRDSALLLNGRSVPASADLTRTWIDSENATRFYTLTTPRAGAAKRVTIELDDQLQVIISGAVYLNVYLRVPGSYRNSPFNDSNVTGLCGNFDGDRTNDPDGDTDIDPCDSLFNDRIPECTRSPTRTPPSSAPTASTTAPPLTVTNDIDPPGTLSTTPNGGSSDPTAPVSTTTNDGSTVDGGTTDPGGDPSTTDATAASSTAVPTTTDATAASSTAVPTTTARVITRPPGDPVCGALWDQCGGTSNGWNGPTACDAESVCNCTSSFYCQCVTRPGYDLFAVCSSTLDCDGQMQCQFGSNSAVTGVCQPTGLCTEPESTTATEASTTMAGTTEGATTGVEPTTASDAPDSTTQNNGLTIDGGGGDPGGDFDTTTIAGTTEGATTGVEPTTTPDAPDSTTQNNGLTIDGGGGDNGGGGDSTTAETPSTTQRQTLPPFTIGPPLDDDGGWLQPEFIIFEQFGFDDAFIIADGGDGEVPVDEFDVTTCDANILAQAQQLCLHIEDDAELYNDCLADVCITVTPAEDDGGDSNETETEAETQFMLDTVMAAAADSVEVTEQVADEVADLNEVKCPTIQFHHGQTSGDCDGNFRDVCVYDGCAIGFVQSEGGNTTRVCEKINSTGTDDADGTGYLGAWSGSPKQCVKQPAIVVAPANGHADAMPSERVQIDVRVFAARGALQTQVEVSLPQWLNVTSTEVPTFGNQIVEPVIIYQHQDIFTHVMTLDFGVVENLAAQDPERTSPAVSNNDSFIIRIIAEVHAASSNYAAHDFQATASVLETAVPSNTQSIAVVVPEITATHSVSTQLARGGDTVSISTLVRVAGSRAVHSLQATCQIDGVAVLTATSSVGSSTTDREAFHGTELAFTAGAAAAIGTVITMEWVGTILVGPPPEAGSVLTGSCSWVFGGVAGATGFEHTSSIAVPIVPLTLRFTAPASATTGSDGIPTVELRDDADTIVIAKASVPRGTSASGMTYAVHMTGFGFQVTAASIAAWGQAITVDEDNVEQQPFTPGRRRRQAPSGIRFSLGDVSSLAPGFIELPTNQVSVDLGGSMAVVAVAPDELVFALSVAQVAPDAAVGAVLRSTATSAGGAAVSADSTFVFASRTSASPTPTPTASPTPAPTPAPTRAPVSSAPTLSPASSTPTTSTPTTSTPTTASPTTASPTTASPTVVLATNFGESAGSAGSADDSSASLGAGASAAIVLGVLIAILSIVVVGVVLQRRKREAAKDDVEAAGVGGSSDWSRTLDDDRCQGTPALVFGTVTPEFQPDEAGTMRLKSVARQNPAYQGRSDSYNDSLVLATDDVDGPTYDMGTGSKATPQGLDYVIGSGTAAVDYSMANNSAAAEYADSPSLGNDDGNATYALAANGGGDTDNIYAMATAEAKQPTAPHGNADAATYDMATAVNPTQHSSATYDNPNSGSNSDMYSLAAAGNEQFKRRSTLKVLEPTYELAADSKTGTMESTSEL